MAYRGCKGLTLFAPSPAEATVVAIDCVELAPIPGSHASEFFAAKLCIKRSVCDAT